MHNLFKYVNEPNVRLSTYIYTCLLEKSTTAELNFPRIEVKVYYIWTRDVCPVTKCRKKKTIHTRGGIENGRFTLKTHQMFKFRPHFAQ